MNEIDTLQTKFAEFARSMASDTPLYSSLASKVAQRPDLAGLLMANIHPDRRIPVLLFAAVHDEVLRTPDCLLGDWYGSVREHVRTDDPFPAFDQMCHDRRDRIEETIASQTVQTNEVGRTAFLLLGVEAAAERLGSKDGVALVDVGTSAGLNLCLDKYRVDYSPGGTSGPADSPVRISCRTADGFVAPTAPTVLGRFGIDQSPIDISDTERSRWLLACVWPDQAERFRRLQAAMGIARSTDRVLVSGDASGDLRSLIEQNRVDAPVVLMNSWLLNYLTPSGRRSFVEELDVVGSERPLAWVWAESPAETAELPWPDELAGPRASALNRHATQLMVSTWRSGTRVDEHLAVCHPHGRRVTPTALARHSGQPTSV